MEGLEAIFRWLHILAGITWIGHLYFFNWVNGPFQGKIDGPTKKIVNPVEIIGTEFSPFVVQFVSELFPLRS